MFEGKCYQLELSWRSWNEAEEHCRRNEGHLVSITSEEINSFLLKQLKLASKSAVWIGAKYGQKFDEAAWEWGWTWSDGSLWSYENWAYDVITQQNEPKCGQMMQYGTAKNWIWGECNYGRNFICSKKSCSEITSTVASIIETTMDNSIDANNQGVMNHHIYWLNEEAKCLSRSCT